MDDSGRREPDHLRQPDRGRIIDVSGDDPVIVTDEGSDSPSIFSNAERIRVFTTTGGARTCAIPLIVILILLCCSCIAVWSLTDNIF